MAMGLLELKRLISMQRRRRRQIQDRNGLIISVAKRKDSCCQEDDNSQGGKRLKYSGPDLAEDIWCHIYSMMPLRDAARLACVCHAFLCSWRCHPNLTLNEHTLSLKDNAPGRDFIRKVDHILKNHSGTNVKTLSVELSEFIYDVNVRCRHLNSWLQFAIAPGIEEITLINNHGKYNFPCSLLSDGVRNSIRYLHLCRCAFHPTIELASFRSLIRLHLRFVRITGDELGCFLLNSVALERLELRYCPEIVCLKIHCLLLRLNYLEVLECRRLEVIQSNAPNISAFDFSSENNVEISLGDSLKMKKIDMYGKNLVFYACSKLPSSVPNIESLTINSYREVVNMSMLPTKFIYLKYLTISLDDCDFSRAYDYFSLVYLLDASPSLEDFTLHVSQHCMKQKLIIGDSLHMRQMTEICHGNLKSVKITGFCFVKSLVELACHIVENTVSLEYLTLDTTDGAWCSAENSSKCTPMSNGILMEAHRALLAIRTYIQGKVPSTVSLSVMQPCTQCHGVVH